MPGGLEAALVAAVLVVPGYLFLAGYRMGRASPSHPDALTSVARAFTASAALVLVAWKLGGQSLYEHARAATALSDDEPLTFRLAVAGLVVPPIVGVLAGEATDLLASRVAHALAGLGGGEHGVAFGVLDRTQDLLDVQVARLWRDRRAGLPSDRADDRLAIGCHAGEHIAVVEWIGHDGITEIRTDG